MRFRLNRNDLKKRSVARLKTAFEVARDQHGGTAEPKILYHFCDHETAEKILASHVLWACDLRASKNDPNELDRGFELLDVALPGNTVLMAVGPDVGAKLRELCEHVACLSSELTVSSQWDRYANHGAGCAIGFCIEELHRLCCAKEIMHFAMIYDPDIQIAAFRHFLDEAGKIPWRALSPAGRKACHDDVLRSLATLAHRSKNEKFESENEWRLWINCDDRFERVERNI